MSNFLLSTIKFILVLLLIPVVIAGAANFYEHLTVYSDEYRKIFLWGAVTFLMTFLFLHPLRRIYEFGQTLVGGLFKFAVPLDQFLSDIFPFYLVGILLGLNGVIRFWKTDQYNYPLVFFAGFAFGMHILHVARDLKEQQTNPINPSYFLRICIVFIAMISIVILLLDWSIHKFTFPSFLQATINDANAHYLFIYHSLMTKKGI